MPGVNCSVKGCSTSRRTKGISIFKIPKASNVTQEEWRNEMVSVITRDREIDQDLRRKIKEDRLHICEKHFNKDDMYHCKHFFSCLFFCLFFMDPQAQETDRRQSNLLNHRYITVAYCSIYCNIHARTVLNPALAPPKITLLPDLHCFI